VVDAAALLQRSAIFRGIPREQLEPLIGALRRRTFTRGAYLFHEDDAGNQLYLIVSGQVKISRIVGGEEVIFAMLTAGDVFGELALFDPAGTRTSDAQAIETTECLTLRRESVLGFLDAHPEALRNLVALLVAYIRRKDDAFTDVAVLDIPGRVARKLLDLAEAHGEAAPEGVRIQMRISQRMLAAMVGASRENVNRALVRFAADGAIRHHAGQITVVRPEALRRRI
jgi:CRP/FNR family transcriptional regulator, cyclic AMP receptor protein